ncbi:MAG: hypothetical protein ACPGVU_07165, partial [Limisphaerales bacterium]
EHLLAGFDPTNTGHAQVLPAGCRKDGASVRREQPSVPKAPVLSPSIDLCPCEIYHRQTAAFMRNLLSLLAIASVLLITTACDPKPIPSESIPPVPESAKGKSPVQESKPAELKEILHQTQFSGSGTLTQTGMKQHLGDEQIEIDFDSTYRFTATAAASGSDAVKERQYLGFACFDSDGHGISTYHVAKYPGSTDTILAADLNPGDRQIKLADATGWNNEGTEHRCAIAWYGYTNKAGHTYPDYTYTRHFVADLWEADAVEGNTITLAKPWPGPALKAGTAVRNAESGGSYNYAMNGGSAVPENATDYEATVTGVWEDGTYSDTVFRPGTAFIRPLVLANWGGSESTLTVSDFKIVVTP